MNKQIKHWQIATLIIARNLIASVNSVQTIPTELSIILDNCAAMLRAIAEELDQLMSSQASGK